MRLRPDSVRIRSIRNNIRWTICFTLLALVTHALLTRAGMSIAAQGIRQEFGLTDVQVGWILSGFILGYAIPQFPAGVLVDRWGAHRFLVFSALGWSFFTLLTGLTPWFAVGGIVVALYVVRFVMGISQAAALTCAIKTNSAWIPISERATANGLVMMGIGFGAMLASPLVVSLMVRFGWQAPFFVFGLAGMLLGGFWAWYGKDRPEQHRLITAKELAHIRGLQEASAGVTHPPGRWYELLRHPRIWALAMSYGISAYLSYVIFTWFFLYLVNERRVNVVASGYWTMLPPLAMTFGTLLGGRISDALSARYGRGIGRLGVVLCGELLAGMLIAVGARVADPYTAVLVMAAGAGLHFIGQSPSWAAAIDLAPGRSATVFGVMNTLAQLVGAVAPILTPAIANRFGWVSALDFAALTPALAAVCWIFVKPHRPVDLPHASRS